MAANPKFIHLLEMLSVATLQGRLDWSETFGEDTYRVALDKASVRIEKEADEYKATLFNEGNPVDELTSGDGDPGHIRVLKNLYETVQSQYEQKRDELIDRLILNVSSRKPVR